MSLGNIRCTRSFFFLTLRLLASIHAGGMSGGGVVIHFFRCLSSIASSATSPAVIPPVLRGSIPFSVAEASSPAATPASTAAVMVAATSAGESPSAAHEAQRAKSARYRMVCGVGLLDGGQETEIWASLAPRVGRQAHPG